MEVTSVLTWWQEAKAFFQEHIGEAVPQLENDAVRLQRFLDRDQDIVVCVLGQAAIGKSTLLNALVAGSETVLPAGGIGPLTALATQVRFSQEPYLRVRYKEVRQLHGVRLALEAELRRQGRVVEPASPEEAPDAQSPLALIETGDPGEPTADLPGEAEGRARGDGEGNAAEHRRTIDAERRKRVEELAQQVRQVVKGDQFAEASLEELVAGFRRVLGLDTPGLASLSEADDVRTRRAAIALASGRGGKSVLHSKASVGQNFAALLREHASGSLAPLIAEIEVGWPSDILKAGLVLVDLPGVGVASDRHRAVTSEFIRERARAIILVVDRSGPTDASVELIRDSGYWDRLLLSAGDAESDPCALLIAVSKTDEVAEEEHRGLPKEQRPRKRDILARLRPEMEERIRAQAAVGFAKLSDAETEDEVVRAARIGAGKALLESMRVFAVSATQYRDLKAADDDEDVRPFVRDPEDTGIPQLQGHLTQLASNHRADMASARDEVASRILRTASTYLDRTQTLWTENMRAAEEAVKLREELDRFLEPKCLELANREGAFREFLEGTATTRIDELVAKAQASAQEEVNGYLWGLRQLHWATLRATVTRGGAYVSNVGRRVDLAADVAQRFQEPMAAVWGQTLLRQVRTRTQAHGRALEDIVREICEWADQRSDTRVQKEVLAAQHKLIRDRVEQLGQVGREAVDELKDAIKRDLVQRIATPIRSACERFVARGDAYGPGVKRRVLDLFDELSRTAVREAAIPAAALLKARFAEVQLEILRALAEWGNPVQQAADAVVEREETRQRRSDAQRRTKVLHELEELRTCMPAAPQQLAA
ncbi:dynamin family protein [Belnapia rosea]|uniref:Dynamin family protein n=1 Tax=Belnapia rosea TaxID=938405 RepID=A0A1G7ATR2_9PROT|nr:dynamin family protein [Belnapia rosea]SDE18171.1 Dynamin family protein [Belnapia rosea]